MGVFEGSTTDIYDEVGKLISLVSGENAPSVASYKSGSNQVSFVNYLSWNQDGELAID
jgi:hypothetical protein